MWTCYKRLFNGINANTIICIVYKSHYEALNIPKTATHKEVKDAYYRLSMIYHPDKNKGSEEAAKTFRDINSAYEVLGNVRQRRLYDTGTNINQKVSQYYHKQPFETMNSKSDFYKTNVRGRYNFDEWSKAHYTNIFQQHHFNREMLSRRKKYGDYASKQHSYSILTIVILFCVLVLILMYDFMEMSTSERDKIKTFSEKNKTND